MLGMLLGVLPNFLLHGLQAYLQATTSQAVEAERTERQVSLATINGIVALRQAQASLIQTGMGHTAFWIPWLTAAVPMALWFGWGMVNTLWPGLPLPHVAEIPPGLKPYADVIWENLFYAGGGVLGASAIAGAIARRK
jgi:hypothetical protein